VCGVHLWRDALEQYRRSQLISCAVLVSLGLHIFLLAGLWAEGSRVDRLKPIPLSVRLIPNAQSIELQEQPMKIEAADKPDVTLFDKSLAPNSDAMVGLPDALHFYDASTLTDLPWIPGQPVFDFSRSGIPDTAINGMLDFELLIDEFGKVVNHRILTVTGLDKVIETLLVNQFSKYPFHPAQIGERAVKSRIRFRIEIANGRQQVPVGSLP
jgi:hypothetical protein